MWWYDPDRIAGVEYRMRKPITASAALGHHWSNFLGGRGGDFFGGTQQDIQSIGKAVGWG